MKLIDTFRQKIRRTYQEAIQYQQIKTEESHATSDTTKKSTKPPDNQRCSIIQTLQVLHQVQERMVIMIVIPMILLQCIIFSDNLELE